MYKGYVSKGGSVWDGKNFSDREWYWEGKKRPPSYDCDYHTGGFKGKLLLAIIKGTNHAMS